MRTNLIVHLLSAAVILIGACPASSLAKPEPKHGVPVKAKSAPAQEDQADAQGGSGPLVAFLTLDGPIVSRRQPALDLIGSDAPLGVLELVDAIRNVATDPGVHGLVIQLKSPELDGAVVEELGDAIKRVRAAGKKVQVFSYLYGPSELALASYADEAMIQTGGAVSLPGVHMEEMFFADLFAWGGVKPDFVQIGDYKGASEAMMNARPSPQWEQNISGLLDALYDTSRERLKAGRKLSDAKLDEAMKACFDADAATAKSAGLIDTDIDRLDLEAQAEKVWGADFDWTEDLSDTIRNQGKPDFEKMGLFEAFGEVMKLLKQDDTPRTTRDTVAVLHIDAEIVDGESGSGGGLMGSDAVGSETVRQALADIEDDDNVKGLVVRVDSPGGSAVASEIMWQGIRRVAAKKPVFTSVGGMAASGGYYVAVAGDRIFVDPSSIVGSIGVVGGKLAMGGLYDKLHINVVERSRGPLGGIEGSIKPWTDSERDLIRAKMNETYTLFTQRVSAGRKGIDLKTTAEGRLFTGTQAITNNMADEIGGLATAVDKMSEKLGLAEGSYDVVDYPEPMTIGEAIRGSIGGGLIRAPGVSAGANTPSLAAGVIGSALKEVLGDRAWRQVRSQVRALMQLRKSPVVLAAPRVIFLK